jgi:formamidopyrimidine-DNA glycosylase
MPELPEVETTVRQLSKKVQNRAFLDVWTDFKKMIKKPKSFEQFKKEIIGRKIQRVWRRGKNILFELSQGKTLLIHQKLTGHLLLGRWQKKNNSWLPPAGPLTEKINTYLHLLFILDNRQMLALSDLRKFAKVELWDSRELMDSKEMKELGPEPLAKNFTFLKFKEVLKKKKGRIKQILMDQQVLAGIGNIYSDEILWRAKIHPFKRTERLSERELRKIYQEMKKVLTLAIKLCGESISDYRTPSGQPGFFDRARKVYQREEEKCSRCGTKIQRKKISGRSAHFCPNCQKLKIRS